VTDAKKRLTKHTLTALLKQARNEPQEVLLDSPGGDWLATMEFVENIRREGLEKNLAFNIHYSNSAATYILLSLPECKRVLKPQGLVCAHAGMIRMELNVLVLGGFIDKIPQYYNGYLSLIESIVSEVRYQKFRDTNHLDLTSVECQNAGIVLEPSGSHT
jgi:hypothetical protein